jgi:DNA-binding transcriptional LysR family regulator
LKDNHQNQLGLANWDGPRIFMEVVRAGSPSLAAQRLGHSARWVRIRIDAFERQIGSSLFERSSRDARLTPKGHEVLLAVERIENITIDMLRPRQAPALRDAIPVRVAATEGLGGAWLTRFLADFDRINPGMIDLRCSMQPVDLSKREVDIAVQLFEPIGEGLHKKKLGRLHFMMFASEEYLDAYGIPRSIDDFLKHRLVLQVSPQTLYEEALRDFPILADNRISTMRTNSSAANFWAIARGAGLGALPTYTYAFDPKLVPVDLEINYRQDIWLAHHSKSAVIQDVVDWLSDAFDSEKYPWFSDQFIHPKDLKKKYAGKPLAIMQEALEPTLEAFEISGEAVVLLGKDGRILRKNKSAAELLTNDITIFDDRIVARDRQALYALQTTVANLLSPQSTETFANPVAFPRRGRRPVLAYPLKLTSLSGTGFSECQAAVLFIDPDNGDAVRV